MFAHTSKVLIAFLLTLTAASTAENPDWTALERDFDALFQRAMETYHIPGMAVTVVYEGKRVLSKGYGVSDVENATPVDPERTLFRIGSVTKTLTATGIVHRMEHGGLDLHTDVNEYLEAVTVPQRYDEPITLYHLLTHTAGLDERFLELGKPTPGELEPLGEYLARRLPPRVQPPGEILNYSNFGITLAAQVLAEHSGQTFAEYMDEHILMPLGFPRGGFDQPLTDEMNARLSKTYSYRDGQYLASPLRGAASQVFPAGAYCATANDMANFMIMQLEQGTFAGKPILSPESVENLHARHWQNHPELTRAQGLGFHLWTWRGHEVVWHTGRVNKFASELILIPSLRAGFFASGNADDADETRLPAFEVFARHVIPETAEHPPPAPRVQRSTAQLAEYTGAYRQVRSVKSTFEKVGFIAQEIYIEPNGEGALTTRKFMGGITDTWEPIGDDVFEAPPQPGRPAEPRRLAFVRDDTGEIIYACPEPDKFTIIESFDRLAWYEETGTQILAVCTALLLLLSMIGRWAYAELRTRPANVIARLTGLGAAVLVLFCVALGASVGLIVSDDPYVLAFGLPVFVRTLLYLPPFAALLLFCAFTLLVLPRGRLRGMGWLGRAHLWICVGGGALLLSVLHYWNLLGIRT